MIGSAPACINIVGLGTEDKSLSHMCSEVSRANVLNAAEDVTGITVMLSHPASGHRQDLLTVSHLATPHIAPVTTEAISSI